MYSTTSGCNHEPTPGELCNEGAVAFCERMQQCGERIDLWGERFSGPTQNTSDRLRDCEREFNERNCAAAPAVPTESCLDSLATAACMQRVRTTEPFQPSCELNEIVCRIDAIGIELPSTCDVVPLIYDWDTDGEAWTEAR
jgi:hypothetical protein